jgi:hypothetical protein
MRGRSLHALAPIGSQEQNAAAVHEPMEGAVADHWCHG